MLFITSTLIVLVAAGIFLAAGELSGFHPEPEWKDVGRLRDRLAEPLPVAPAHRNAARSETLGYCALLRREYQSAWRLCRFLAPIAGDPGYVGALLIGKIRFHAVLLLATLCAGAGFSTCRDKLLRELRRLSASVRFSALTILTQSDFEQGLTPA